jgi:hypothetical protein
MEITKGVLMKYRNLLRRMLLCVAIGSVPVLSAIAGSVSVPIVRSATTNAISSVTSPVAGPINKVIAPAADVTPRIGDTTAPINDSAMFRANSALQNQIASDSSGYISK